MSEYKIIQEKKILEYSTKVNISITLQLFFVCLHFLTHFRKLGYTFIEKLY